ncbi:hypothetical protein WJX82_003378 [Trebouxia sp. C0006]
MGGLLQEDGRDFLFYFVGQKDAVKLQDELEWLDAAEAHCWRCKHCRQNDFKPVNGTVYEDFAASSAAPHSTPEYWPRQQGKRCSANLKWQR